jgi:hypothetical protein
MRSFILRLLLLPLAAAAFGCSGTINDLPTTPDPVTVTETFTGTINMNGAETQNFLTTATGTVTATITSLGDNPPAKIGFSLGTLSTIGSCSAVITNDAAVVTTYLTGTVSTLSGALCVRVYDVGAITDPVPYTITVAHP